MIQHDFCQILQLTWKFPCDIMAMMLLHIAIACNLKTSIPDNEFMKHIVYI